MAGFEIEFLGANDIRGINKPYDDVISSIAEA